MRVEGYQLSVQCKTSHSTTGIFSCESEQSNREVEVEIKLIFCSQQTDIIQTDVKQAKGHQCLAWLIAGLSQGIYQLEINGNYIYHEEDKKCGMDS